MNVEASRAWPLPTPLEDTTSLLYNRKNQHRWKSTRRSSSIQIIRKGEQRHGTNMLPRSNSSGRSSCPQPHNVNRRAVENEEQVALHAGEQSTLQQSAKMHTDVGHRNLDFHQQNTASTSFRMPHRTKTSEGRDNGPAHLPEESSGV